MSEKAFQDYYPDSTSHCFGCGRLNDRGLNVKSFWEGDETVSEFRPKPYHMAVPGYVYGGLIASLVDCHSTGSAAAAVYRAEDREMDTEPTVRFVTASLHVDYLAPTPLNGPLKLRSQFSEVKNRKVIVQTQLSANGQICARAEVIAVRAPKNLIPKQA